MVSLWQVPEDVRTDLPGKDGGCVGRSAEEGFYERRDLLAEEDAEKPDECDDRRRGRAHVEKRIDHADEETCAERQEVESHCGIPLLRKAAGPTVVGSAVADQPSWALNIDLA
ncbi:hypothetical protein GCM10011335_31850 [Aureimonas glaciei]|uniref:Uncharacterized protein n=1 Tax=Aureimonas glaciei TaxID=1776957 RepID=A0A916Y2G8_9HYPH|nr:hypothetical protein GCM10011335_31850 [Aureimonas glaciei]